MLRAIRKPSAGLVQGQKQPNHGVSWFWGAENAGILGVFFGVWAASCALEELWKCLVGVGGYSC